LGSDGTLARRPMAPIDTPSAMAGVRVPDRLCGISPNPEGGFPGLPAVIDIGTGQVAWARLGPRRFSGQPVPVPSTGGHVWLASLVLDTERRSSELWWFDSE